MSGKDCYCSVDINHLIPLGYSILEGKILNPEGHKVPPTGAARLLQMNGRLNNIAYMANAIDTLDNVAQPAAEVPGGNSQFLHLLTFQGGASAIIYFALRRIQRAGDRQALLIGLSILLAYDHREIEAITAVRHFFPSGAPRALISEDPSINTLMLEAE